MITESSHNFVQYYNRTTVQAALNRLKTVQLGSSTLLAPALQIVSFFFPMIISNAKNTT